MQQPDKTQRTTLVLRSQSLAPADEPETRARVFPVWASPPDVKVLAMLGGCRPEASAALRVIRHRLEQKRSEGICTVGVTSARDGEGKSRLAAQLALVLSESQRARVLLIEACMQKPSLARLFGFEVPRGLGFSAQIARRMRGATDPWAVLALGPALHTLVENEAETGYPETLHSIHFRHAVEKLGRGYDWVVVDAPSVLGSGDANVVEEAVDGMILAARSQSSKGADLRAAIRQLGDRKSLGVVLWDAAAPPLK